LSGRFLHGHALKACLSATLFFLIAVRGAKSSSVVNGNQTPSSPAKTYRDNMMVCNLIQDSHVNEAFTKLEAKLEALIALVNKTYTPQPTPGKLTRSLIV